MKFSNYFENEPSTYTRLKKKADLSVEEFKKSLDEINIDNHSQIKNANLFASRIKIFFYNYLQKYDVNFLDCGCGLGFIARELQKICDYKVFYCDPSESVKKIHEKIFQDDNFFQSDIESLSSFKKNYDIIYLREIYPFTRDSNIENQKKLINILINQLKDKGFLIFEQIKNENDLFSNLRKLKVNYEIIYLLPSRFGEKKFLNLIFFKVKFLQFLLRFTYKIFNKKINHFILIHKI